MPDKTIEINEQFRKALELMENSSLSVLVTGKAGTGKSTLLDYFRRHTKKSVAVLAPTGVAAVNVKGQTIHSFCHFKPDVTCEQAARIGARLIRRGKDKIYKKLDSVVIDEVSMVRPDLMDCVDVFLRTIRHKKGHPFGGLQMVFIGDLYQLPPVFTSNERKAFGIVYQGRYFFDAHVFAEIKPGFVELEKVYRQKDEEFIRLLNSVRNNSITDEDIRILNTRFKPDFEAKDGFCVYLTTTNDKAAEINSKRLSTLPGKTLAFEGKIEGEFSRESLPTDISLHLKKGAQIMLLNNDPRGRWINGSIGVVTGFDKEDVGVKLDNGKVVGIEPFTWELFHYGFNHDTNSLVTETVGTFTQYPLKLAWAITIHKSQGKTFDRLIIDVGRGIFATGQMYVALSRCTTLEGIVLKKELKKHHVLVDYRIIKFLTQYQYKISEEKTPLARKIRQIKEAIRDERNMEIVYLKNSDEKSRRVIKPAVVEEMEYCGKKFLGVKGFCRRRWKDRVFRVDRILEMKVL